MGVFRTGKVIAQKKEKSVCLENQCFPCLKVGIVGRTSELKTALRNYFSAILMVNPFKG